jgi:hypothetical protein
MGCVVGVIPIKSRNPVGRNGIKLSEVGLQSSSEESDEIMR